MREHRPVGPVRAVLFDFDGTLTLPGHLDFAEIRRAIGCPPAASLLGYIESLPDAAARERASEILDRYETEAAERSEEDPDAALVVRFCRERGLRLGIITRNSRRSLQRSFEGFSSIAPEDFEVILTRDDPVEVKPAPDGVLHLCGALGIEPAEAVVVGDFIYDIEAGTRAGAVTVFYDSNPERSFAAPDADHTIDRLGELAGVLSLYLPLPAGKVPNEMLARFLPRGSGDTVTAGPDGLENYQSLRVGPGIGEDAAAIDLEKLPRSGDDQTEGPLLLLKSDPITFVAEDFGHFLLTVNANDIAAAGGTPRWLLATLLVPPGTLGIEIGRLFADLQDGCARHGVVLCGGHTELTDAVVRPVVSGTMVGTVSPSRLIDKRSMGAGDVVILTKAIAVEGTAIIAAEHTTRLRKLGIDDGVIRRGAALREQMSVLSEARVAADHGGVTAMHDVTEGGIATALAELSTAGGCRLRIDLGLIPIHPETGEICRAIGIDPLGLIGSGSLLICVVPDESAALLRKLSDHGLRASAIGEVLGPGTGVAAERSGEPCDLPSFEVDELTRI